ncbi:DUF6158 family protein [Sphaerisporangium sp. NPDC005288]|uniref:DUF6158 family protein n=1 Tax=Sphaerisporangium sp. NPDC005288 TaxID=3155114 RepID=UPI0033AEB5B0
MNRVDPRNLSVRDLRAELQELEESWMETLLRGSEDAVDDFASRTRELEEEFDRRQRERAGEPAPTSQDAGLSGQDPAPISQDPAHTSQDPALSGQDPALSGQGPAQTSQDPALSGQDPVSGGEDAVPGGRESDLRPVAGREPERTASQAMGGEPRGEAQDGFGPDVDAESRREAQGELRLDVDGAPAAPPAPPFPHEAVSTPVASPAVPEAAPSPAVSEAAPSPAAPPVGPEAAVSPAGPEAAVSPAVPEAAVPEAGVPSDGSPAVREEPAGAYRGWDGAGVAGDGGRGRAIRPGRRRRDGVPAVREQRSPGKVA